MNTNMTKKEHIIYNLEDVFEQFPEEKEVLVTVQQPKNKE